MEQRTLAGPSRLGIIRERIETFVAGIGQTLARQSRPALAESNRDLAVSSASVGVTVAGLWTMQPILLLAGIPLVLYVYAPSFQAAWRSVRRHRRIDNSVLDATRITACVVMGYYLVGAANAALFALSQRMIAESEDEFEESLRHLLGLQTPDAWAFVDGVEMETRPDAITSGQILVVTAGDILPAQGVVLHGAAEVDERLATGHVLPVEIGVGDKALMASRVLSGQLAVKVDDSPERLDLTALRESLRSAVQSKTLVQQLGESSGRRAAPLSFFTFFLTIPWLGVNRAASFLCTSFGANMRLLGPTASRRTVQQAMEQGILIKETRILEFAGLTNCLVIDGRALLDPSVALYAAEVVEKLRQRNWQQTGLFGRPFTVYVLADREYEGLAAAAASVGAEDIFVESLSIGRATVIDNLQRSGRVVCFVSSSPDDGPVMEKALVSVALGGLLSAPSSPAQVVFVVKSLVPLLAFFDMAGEFLGKERFSLLTPIFMDMTDIATTLVFHFGLIYSTFFNYGSLLLSLNNARGPRTEPVSEIERIKTVALAPRPPSPQKEGQRTAGEGNKRRKSARNFWAWRKKSGPSWLGA